MLRLLLVLTLLGPRKVPSPKLSPGVVETTDTSKFCRKGYASLRRKEVTAATKRLVWVRYGMKADTAYVLDHVVPIELGGAPNNANNLGPQLKADSKKKDLVENYLHREVCAGRISVQIAQRDIRYNWKKKGWLPPRNSH